MPKWFEMKKQDGADGGGATCEILIYDFIGKDFWSGEGVDATDFDRALKDCGDVSEILLRINSPGGVVSDGVAIFNMLASHPARVTARVDGIAASAASLIFMAGDVREVPENSFLLIHEPSGFAWGTADQMIAAAADLERMTTVFASTYEKRSKMDNGAVRTLMAEDRLMTATEAVELGLADTLVENVKMAACNSLMALPPKSREAFKAAMAASAPPSIPPVVDPPAPTNVVDLDQVRMQAGDATRAEMLEIVELCTLAGFAGSAQTMIADKKTVAQVRTHLVEMRASRDAAELNSRHGAPVSPTAAATWDNVIAKTNPRR